MASVTVEQLNYLLKGVAEQLRTGFEFLAQGRGEGKGGGDKGRALLDEKHFRRMGVFSGEAGRWLEWASNLGVAVHSANSGCGKAVDRLLKAMFSGL